MLQYTISKKDKNDLYKKQCKWWKKSQKVGSKKVGSKSFKIKWDALNIKQQTRQKRKVIKKLNVLDVDEKFENGDKKGAKKHK